MFGGWFPQILENSIYYFPKYLKKISILNFELLRDFSGCRIRLKNSLQKKMNLGVFDPFNIADKYVQFQITKFVVNQV